jgi:hypothetical protein
MHLCPIILYGCESLSLKLREEHRLRVLENGIVRKELTGDFRKMRNEEIHNVYTLHQILFDQTKEDEMGGACGMHGRDDKCIYIYIYIRKTRSE